MDTELPDPPAGASAAYCAGWDARHQGEECPVGASAAYWSGYEDAGADAGGG